MATISLYYIHDTERNTNFTNVKVVAMYARSFLLEKTEFFKNVKSGSVALAFHFGSCYNAILWQYTL